MPVKAVARTSIARNGLGTYVLPCNKLTLQYCNWGGSSQGMRQILTNGQLNKMALSKPQVMFEVLKRQGHPKLIFRYNDDKTTEVDVRNMKTHEIVEKIDEYIQRSGNELFKCNHKVVSENESVRGIWSPLHTPKGHRYNI